MKFNHNAKNQEMTLTACGDYFYPTLYEIYSTFSNDNNSALKFSDI